MKDHILLIFVVALFFTHARGLFYSDEEDSLDKNPENDLSLLFSSKKINIKKINREISTAQMNYAHMETREEILGHYNIKIEPGTPSHGLFVDSFPEPEATEMMKGSMEAVAVSGLVAFKYCRPESLSNEECGNRLKRIQLWNTALRDSCNRLGKVCTKEQIYAKYRSLDASCNNKVKGESGQSFTVYKRLIYPNYLEGVKQLRRSVTKAELPSARTVSESLHLEATSNNILSLAALFWGQFVEHDLSHTAMSQMVYTGKPIECCDPEYGWTYSPRYQHPFCMPIAISPSDEYYGEKGITCMSYVRSLPAVGPDCSMGPMEQINQATHFLDGSQIYGTTRSKSKNLREFASGLMAVSSINNQTFLPILKDPNVFCQQQASNATCYQSGDKRVNTEPHLTALYTIWVREHNRIASKLAEMNTDWDDEVVFQEARRIVIAEIQHITYNEWIPAVLGISINAEYKPSADPLVSNEFATAAIRAIQSVRRLSLAEEESKYTYHHQNMDKLLNEMIVNIFSGRGLYYIGKPRDITYGLDILSIDIHRGRDHGLPTYNEYRKYCGLEEFEDFEGLEAVMLPKVAEALKKSYRDVKDIDLIVGGMGEQPKKGLFGPTISCILKDQFERTRSSDRYFYTNKEQPMPFSDSQLKEIEKVTFARIICDNSDMIHKIPPRVFESNSQEVLCDSNAIPRLNISLWSTNRYAYTLSS